MSRSGLTVCALVFAGLCIGLPSPSFAQITVETFEGGSNAAGWTISGFDTIEMSGGNPGFWLHAPGADTFGPILTNDPLVPSAFMGDLRADGVSLISLDARTDDMDFPVCGFPFALVLRDTQGTVDPLDDDYAYFWDPTGTELIAPCIGEGWMHYDFDVPTQSTDPVPAGWSGSWAGDPESFRPGIDWNDVIVRVDTVEVWCGAPPLVAIFQNWDVGVDDVAITSSALFVDGFETGDTSAWCRRCRSPGAQTGTALSASTRSTVSPFSTSTSSWYLSSTPRVSLTLSGVSAVSSRAVSAFTQSRVSATPGRL